jgi:hypothetical protein
MTIKRPTCGRCGVYRDLHPTKSCKKPRLSFWWDRHSLARHIAGHAWLALSDRQRFDIVGWLYKRQPNLCWCDFVNSAYLDDMRDDYRGDNGCACDVPLPVGVEEPRPGRCYCLPVDAAAGAQR